MHHVSRCPLVRAFAISALAASAAAQSVPVPSAFTTEWRFTGDTNEFVDSAGGPGTLSYSDGDDGPTDQLDVFTTTQSAGIPDIGGVDSPVLQFGHHNPNTLGYHFRPLTGLGNHYEFSFVWDIYLDPANPDAYQALWQGNATNSNDAELHLEIQTGGFYHASHGGGSGSIGAGSWNLGEWNRFVYVADFNTDVASTYVNGVLAFTDDAVDWLYDGGDPAFPNWILSDQNGDTTEGFIANFAFTEVLLDAATVAALGAPEAGGIFQFPTPSVPYCFCDANSAFPAGLCGNPGSAGNGCANGSNAAGANLSATGAPAPGTLILVGAGATPGQPGLFFQGDNQVAGGSGVGFGDGIRCAGGNVVRLQVVAADATGASQTSIDIFAAGGISPGDVKRYQLWYRDPALSPCGSTFNLSNGLQITW
jgi:hypothetical protein